MRVEGQLTRWRVAMEWLVADARAHAASPIATRSPSQLGADRWASCVAARLRAIASRRDAAADHRRQRRHRGHDRLGRRRRRVPRRHDPAEHAPDAALARREHGGAQGRRRAASSSSRPTPPMRSTPARCTRCAARSSSRARGCRTQGDAGPLLPRRRRGAGDRRRTSPRRWSSWIISCSKALLARSANAIERDATHDADMRIVVILLLLANLTLFALTRLDCGAGGEAAAARRAGAARQDQAADAAAGGGARAGEGRGARRRVRRMGTVVRSASARARSPSSRRWRSAALVTSRRVDDRRLCR